jgi:hypothetical protein
MATKFDLVPS